MQRSACWSEHCRLSNKNTVTQTEKEKEKMLQSHANGYGNGSSLSQFAAFPSSVTDPAHMLDEAKLLFTCTSTILTLMKIHEESHVSSMHRQECSPALSLPFKHWSSLLLALFWISI